jgi:hypothetical protein
MSRQTSSRTYEIIVEANRQKEGKIIALGGTFDCCDLGDRHQRAAMSWNSTQMNQADESPFFAMVSIVF